MTGIIEREGIDFDPQDGESYSTREVLTPDEVIHPWMEEDLQDDPFYDPDQPTIIINAESKRIFPGDSVFDSSDVQDSTIEEEDDAEIENDTESAEAGQEVEESAPLQERVNEVIDAREAWIALSVSGNGRIVGEGRKYKAAKEAYEQSLGNFMAYVVTHPEEARDVLGIKAKNLDSDDPEEREKARRKIAVKTSINEKHAIDEGRAKLLEERGNTKRAKVVNWYQKQGKVTKFVLGAGVAGAVTVGGGAVVGGGAMLAGAIGVTKFTRSLANSYKGYSESEEAKDFDRDAEKAAAKKLYKEMSNKNGEMQDGHEFIRQSITQEMDASLAETRKANQKAVAFAVGSVALGNTIGMLYKDSFGIRGGIKNAFNRVNVDGANWLNDNVARPLAGREGPSPNPAGGGGSGTFTEQASVRFNHEPGNGFSNEISSDVVDREPIQEVSAATEPELEGEANQADANVEASDDSAEVLENPEQKFTAFEGSLESNEGATHLMDQLFDGQYAPEELHNVYLAALEEQGSGGLADLFDNAEALDAPVDQWGTQTYFAPGENGISAEGVEYFYDLSTRLAEDAEHAFTISHTPEINPSLLEVVEASDGDLAAAESADTSLAEATDTAEAEIPTAYELVDNVDAVIDGYNVVTQPVEVFARQVTGGNSTMVALIEDAIRNVNTVHGTSLEYGGGTNIATNSIHNADGTRFLLDDKTRVFEEMVRLIKLG